MFKRAVLFASPSTKRLPSGLKACHVPRAQQRQEFFKQRDSIGLTRDDSITILLIKSCYLLKRCQTARRKPSTPTKSRAIRDSAGKTGEDRRTGECGGEG